jgi:hypothetical protein
MEKHVRNRLIIWGIAISGLFLFNHFVPLSGVKPNTVSFVSATYAADGKNEKYPYGGSRGGIYGEKKTVSSMDDAAKILREYFSNRALTIGEIREKDLYYEADVLDKNGKIVDKVIVDKRTGRIRSIY